jgi:DNA processing protein
MMWLASATTTRCAEKLLEYFDTAEDIWEASAATLEKTGILKGDGLDRLIASRYRMDFDKEINMLYERNVRFVVRNDEEYPQRLRGIPDEPLGLYIKGNIPEDGQQHHYVSIVGSRQIDSYGRMCCDRLVKELAESGAVIVSGMAMGTDTVAHTSAIKYGGKTIAVLGTGADVCYPASNDRLYASIVANGCVMSEYRLGTAAFPANFPQRNRIISGLSEATIVIEARKKSGTMITVRHALEQGRLVMALPGNINNSLCEGTNNLIKEGALPITCVSDVLDAIGINKNYKNIKKQQKNEISLAPNEKLVYDCMDYEPITVDEIVVKTNLSIQEVAYNLTLLELKSAIQKLSGQKYVKSL